MDQLTGNRNSMMIINKKYADSLDGSNSGETFTVRDSIMSHAQHPASLI